MTKLLYTDHSTLNQNNNSRFLRWPALFVPAFFLFCHSVSGAELKIAILDTGFCPEQIKTQHILEKSIDATDSVKLECKVLTLKEARMHGQNVLKTFLTSYTGTAKLHVYPIIIFDKRGQQKKEYWKKAMGIIEDKKIDVTIAAAGLIGGEKISLTLPGLWFVSSGRIGPGIKENTALFPQNLAPLKNLFLIGDFLEGPIYDPGLMYQDKIDYTFASGPDDFNGTSKAVALGAGLALSVCSTRKMRDCLFKRRKEMTDPVMKKKFFTY